MEASKFGKQKQCVTFAFHMALQLLIPAVEASIFERLLIQRSLRTPESNLERLREAFSDAAAMYGDQLHWTGERLLSHCLGVFDTVLPFDVDDEGIIACLLHHVLDTKLWTLDDLEEKYGPSVRAIVSGTHLLSHVTMKNRRMSLENLRLMLLRVSDDIRVVLLILCEHKYKLGKLETLSPDIRRSICRDVLLLFAPVAARLGIYSLKHQMESKAFPVAYPIDSNRIEEQLHQIHTRNGDFLNESARSLTEHLAEAGIVARVEGREKQPYSIFQKMRHKSVTHVEDIYDLFALRVIVKTESECYQTLGQLHRIGHPVVNRFKDYIAFPKPNGYQSLHTTLARLPGVPEGIFIEVQIRTEAMHREADLGIAAHWSYKEGGAVQYAKRRAQLQRALSLQQPLEETTKRSVLTDHIFALTPKGDIIELPEGATPLDFAFNVHTMLGLCYKAARVNGNIVPLTYRLENGDIVEIIKHHEPHPSSNWMQLLKTTAAKSRLKRYLLAQDRPAFVQLGRELLNTELHRQHLPHLDPDLSLLKLFDGKRLTQAEREDVLVSIGQSAQQPSSILPHLDALHEWAEKMRRIADVKHKAPPPSSPAVAQVEGDIPMPVRYARCCKADEGVCKEITGVVGRDGVVRVHRSTCKHIRNGNPERRIGVTWVRQKA